MKKKKRDIIVSIMFLTPALILLFCLIIYPVINTVNLSFRSWNGVYGMPKVFVGLKNFRDVVTNANFWKSLLHSMYFLMGGFFILMPLSFVLALIVTSKLKWKKLFKTAYFMPIMLSSTAVALIWVYMLNPQYGAINKILEIIGCGSLAKDWLATPNVNVWSVVLVNEWMYAGYNMLIFAAGLVSIPSDLYEAAVIDGCTSWKKLRYVTLPLMKNSFKIFSILCVTGCLKTFDLIWAMTKGGPNRSSEMPATLIYNEAFSFRQFGRSSAIGVVLLIIGLLLSVLMNYIFRDKDKVVKQ